MEEDRVEKWLVRNDSQLNLYVAVFLDLSVRLVQYRCLKFQLHCTEFESFLMLWINLKKVFQVNLDTIELLN